MEVQSALTTFSPPHPHHPSDALGEEYDALTCFPRQDIPLPSTFPLNPPSSPPLQINERRSKSTANSTFSLSLPHTQLPTRHLTTHNSTPRGDACKQEFQSRTVTRTRGRDGDDARTG